MFTRPRNRTLLLAVVTSATLVGCEAAHRDDPADRPDEVPPVQWTAGEGSRVLAFSPDGRTVVTHYLRTVQFWDVTTGKKKFEQYADDTQFTLSPDGLRLAFVTGHDLTRQTKCTLSVREIGTDGQTKDGWRAEVGSWGSSATDAGSAAFSPEGRLIAFGTADESIHIWDAATGKELQSFRGGVAVCYSLDGKELLAVRHSGGLRRFDAATGKPLSDVLRGKNPDFIWAGSVAFSADRRCVAIADHHTVLLKDANTGKTYARVELEDQIRSLQFTPDGRTLAIPCSKCVVVCNGETGMEQGRFYPRADTVESFALSGDGTMCAWTESPARELSDGVVHVCPLANLPLAAKRPKPVVELPIKAEWVVGTGEIVIDRKGKTAEQYCDGEFEQPYNRHSELSWSVRLTNVGKQKITLKHKDEIRPISFLFGPGALNVCRGGQICLSGSPDDDLALAPGEHHTIPIKQLNGGYFMSSPTWVAPGPYTVRASVCLSVTVAPPGATIVNSDGSGYIDVPITPVQITVREKP